MENIGILGSGVVATTLADGFIKYGYNVCVGTSHPEKLDTWKAKHGDKVSVGSFEDAATCGDILVLAVKGDVAISVLKSADKKTWKAKLLLIPATPLRQRRRSTAYSGILLR